MDIKRVIPLVVLLFLNVAILTSCSNDSNPSTPDPEPEPDPGPSTEVDWNARADKSTSALINHFWNDSGNYWNTRTDSETFAYWTGAHAADVLIDAYLRTNNSRYIQYVNDWFNGVLSEMNGTFVNDFYDDMEWNALTLLRAYDMTDDTKYIIT